MNTFDYIPTTTKIRSCVSLRDKLAMVFDLFMLFAYYPMYHVKALRRLPLHSVLKDYKLSVNGITFVMPGNCPPENTLTNDQYEPEVKAIISKFNKGVFVDCGAGIGLYTLMVAKNMDHFGTVIAFEPDEQMFDRITKSMAQYPNVKVFKAAVWKEETTLRLYSHPFIRFQSSVKDDSGPAEYSDHFEEVPAMTIDSVVPKLLSPVLMKLDIEGAEPEAMVGAIRTLLRKDIIVIFEALTDKALERCKSVIEPLGYSVAKLSERDYLAMRRGRA